MPSRRTRHSRGKVKENYAKPWDEARHVLSLSCTGLCVCVCGTYVRIYACTHVRMYASTHVRMYVCTQICMYILEFPKTPDKAKMYYTRLLQMIDIILISGCGQTGLNRTFSWEMLLTIWRWWY